jgi:hypothetical protein
MFLICPWIIMSQFCFVCVCLSARAHKPSHFETHFFQKEEKSQLEA